MTEKLRITFDIPSPKSDEAALAVIGGMFAALPNGPGHVRFTVSGISEQLEAALTTGFAIGKAQIAAKRKTPEA